MSNYSKRSIELLQLNLVKRYEDGGIPVKGESAMEEVAQ